MAQTATGVKAPKEPPDAPPAQAPTHARPRTAGRHHDAQLPTRSPSQRLHASASLQPGTRLTHAARPRRQAPPPRTHAGVQAPAAHPRRTRAPRTHERPEHACLGTHHHAPGNKPVSILQPRACDAGNKIDASAHGMGSGSSAVDAMPVVIGRLGVDRRAELFFSYLAILAGLRT